MSERKREKERKEKQALDTLRTRIVSDIHSGHLDSGDRLPSYREVAAEMGLDLRAVARIFDALNREGLLEIRDKQGIFVATQQRLGGRVLAETARWFMAVLRDAWTRRIPIPRFAAFAHECVATVPVRGACIESTQDQLVSLCTELKHDFGIETSAVHASLLTTSSHEPQELPPEITSADFLISTLFHAAGLRSLANALGKPLVTVRLDPRIAQAFERRVNEGELIVVCVDPNFVERVRLVVGDHYSERVHGVRAADREAVARLDRDQPVLITRAAREQLHDVALPPNVIPANVPILSSETATELIELILQRNLEAMRQASPSA
ncbi:MAG: GntR family transcriptional regulator [Gemmatimonadota bacterium]